MTLDDLFNAIKNYGATGILTVWLFVTYNKVNRLEGLLFDCYRAKSVMATQQPLKKENKDEPLNLAILVCSPIIKKYEDDNSCID